MTIDVRDNTTGSSKSVKTSQAADVSPDVSVYVPHHNIDAISEGNYETVAASQTEQILGAAGSAGDYLRGLLIVPATTGAGSVSIKDGTGTAITVFVSGTLADLRPFFLDLWMRSNAGAWKVTTGGNVSVVAVGNFT